MSRSLIFLVLLALVLLAAPVGLSAQLSPTSLQDMALAAQAEGATLEDRLQGAAAAGLLRDFTQARNILDEAGPSLTGAMGAFVNTQLLRELGSGGGINGIQRRFREARRIMVMEPLNIAGWVNTYPELLVGGEFDEMIEALSAEASDPRYRCECFGQKAWMYRVAGDMERSRIYWDSAATAASQTPLEETTPALRAQRVRNLARAGRTAEARQVIDRALAIDRIDQLPQAAQRNWAQAYAELGDVDRAVEILERLLDMPSQVTVHSLATRVSWDGIRDHPAFQALLERHRSR